MSDKLKRVVVAETEFKTTSLSRQEFDGEKWVTVSDVVFHKGKDLIETTEKMLHLFLQYSTECYHSCRSDGIKTMEYIEFDYSKGEKK